MTENIMDYFSTLVPFLGNILGNNCEIVLFDLQENKRCITAIAHNHISGRKIGSPLSPDILSILDSGRWREKDFECNYPKKRGSSSGSRFSNYFIKQDNKLLGILYISIDDSCYERICQSILELANTSFPCSCQNSEKAFSYADGFSGNLTENIERILNHYLALHQIPSTHLTRQEKILLVEEFYQNGIFLIKGAVPAAAQKLHCSEATIYRYLSKVEKKFSSKLVI